MTAGMAFTPLDAASIGIHPEAALLAVLVGVSADSLTPIGHQNIMLVMGQAATALPTMAEWALCWSFWSWPLPLGC